VFEFNIFRVPVRVEPWFWLTSFFLGNGLQNIDSRAGIFDTLLWMIVVFASILIHELGHALTSRKLTGVQPNIRLVAFGGLAYPNTQLNRSDSLKVTLAGPAAGLAFFVVIILFCIARYGLIPGLDVVIWHITHSKDLLIGNGSAFFNMSETTFSLIKSLIYVNFWWSLVNLLPVYPLDGGQAYAAIESSQKKVYQIGMITGIAAALFGFLFFGSIFVAILFGFLAFQNYQRLEQLGGWK
jgi:stage IV sporulation protein FB